MKATITVETPNSSLRFFSIRFWDTTFAKIVNIFVSVKVWTLICVFLMVNKIYIEAEKYRELTEQYFFKPELVTQLIKIQKDLYDVANAMLIGAIVVIVLSRDSIKHAQIKKDCGVSDNGVGN